ncbi:hypothetical protein [Treponema phagedenis]|uniref:Uncharacterized protein n=1 Tax=Treponema phagedenis TaxID=162 RepID=A0AAF1DBA3_TREPH|nr:hypothetical protein [Treponema phagedenis]QEJ93830.1 hypothetical protein FUT79_00430 [Treponema phagedenis]QEJ96588.1 hypothetical protein FUT82_00230 [Treponema phagedenis]QEK02374.1 hypothetical protein FUT83_00225 [Treponema phagedenis]QEK08005.1 hypothetical protein FUT81_00225 [Treponema phagedenis]
MIGFFLKKNFLDGWDNFLSIIILNLIFIFLCFGGFFLAHLTLFNTYLSIAVLFLMIVCISVFSLAVSMMQAKVANYKSFSSSDFFSAIKETWMHGVLFALVQLLIFFLLLTALPYYFSLQNFLGTVFGITVLWIFIIVELSLLWFLPLRAQLEKNFIKCIKKCFIIFFDNSGFTLFMFAYTIFLIALTPVFAFLAPNLSGIILAWNNAFKLRLYKYDWIEANPDIPIQKARKQIPWDELLEDDIETVGNRSFKNLIFPWKD